MPERADAADAGPAITLYRLQACPFCERVVRALQSLNLPYRSRFVEPLHSERDAVKRVAGTRTVPVIVDERTGVTMAESANVVGYLERTYGEGGPLSDATGTRADAGREAAPSGGGGG
ncbi:MAG: glutaredoxin family protein [Halobacteriaceae archaeon]